MNDVSRCARARVCVCYYRFVKLIRVECRLALSSALIRSVTATSPPFRR